MEKDDLLQAALTYLEKYGFSVIPIKPNKKPYLQWESYQKKKATPEEILGWWNQWPNAMVGIVTGSISGVVVMDVDTEEGQEAISEYIPDTLLPPTCKTPKGGKHLYFKDPEKSISNNSRTIPGCDFRGEGGYVVAPPSENGAGRAYEWIVRLEDTPLPPLPEPYILFINSFKHWGNKGYALNKHTKARVSTSKHELLTLGSRDNDLFHVANCLIKGGMPEDKARQFLEILAESCKPPFGLKEANEKIDSALKRAARRERNLAEDLRRWVLSTDGHFEVTQYYAEARVSTPEEKHAVTQCLRRMVLEGLVEKFGNKRGVYRRVERDCDPIDFLNANDEFVDLRCPFNSHRYVKTLPKNIIVIAGEPNAGKTAYLLNFVKLNMSSHRIHYFSSEMGSIELRNRLGKFDLPLEGWNFDPRERSSNFADVIAGDEINIIDFLEIHDEFYRIGALIKEIYDKLRSGIAIIAIQKNSGTDFGLGGMRGLEKARLYFAMESGRIKIVKAKNWAGQENPNGLMLDFKLVQGCKFLISKDWYKGGNGSR